jgi:hypothetical protein
MYSTHQLLIWNLSEYQGVLYVIVVLESMNTDPDVRGKTNVDYLCLFYILTDNNTSGLRCTASTKRNARQVQVNLSD